MSVLENNEILLSRNSDFLSDQRSTLLQLCTIFYSVTFVLLRTKLNLIYVYQKNNCNLRSTQSSHDEKKKGKKEKKESSDKFKIHCKEMSNCRNKKNM